MKLLTYTHEGRAHFGALRGQDQIVALDGHGYDSLRAALEANALPALAKLADSLPATHKLNEVRLLPPIPSPEKNICVGVNYGKRN
ncbi:DUF2437 domain-containing protein, partial [Achromobacter sp. AGC25]